MRREDRTLNVPASPGAGEATRCDTWVEKWVEVDGTFTGTCDVEGQLSPGGTFRKVTSGTATGGVPLLIAVTPLYYALRLNTTNVLTGEPVAKLSALDRRTEA